MFHRSLCVGHGKHENIVGNVSNVRCGVEKKVGWGKGGGDHMRCFGTSLQGRSSSISTEHKGDITSVATVCAHRTPKYHIKPEN